MPDDDPVSVTPKYLIGVVTKLTGLSIDVVRVWERRYGAVRPVRSAGGTRLYSDADVLRLKRLHRAVERGYGIGQAARLSETELDELIAGDHPTPHQVDPHQSARQRFIAAVQIVDVVNADRELARAATLFPPVELVHKIISPIIDEVRERRVLKEFGIAQERVATGLLRRTLESLIRLYPPSGNHDTLILATPIGEDDDFNLLPAAFLAAARGWRVVSLGAEVPAQEIAVAVRLAEARALLLNIATVNYRLDGELETISSVVPGSVQVWISGAAAFRQGARIGRPSWTVVRDLEELYSRLSDRTG